MKDKSGLLLVAGAALVLMLVVRKSTGAAVAGAPASGGGQSAIGANAAGFWSNVVNNMAGMSPTQMPTGGQYIPGVFGISTFANGTYSDGTIYSDPGQVTYNSDTGQVIESPFSGMYRVLSPATYGF